MNWIICPLLNGLHLTKRALPTFLAQDIGDVGILFLDNGSTDGTQDWLWSIEWSHDIAGVDSLEFNIPVNPGGVAASWNVGLTRVFANPLNGYALVCNSDVELRPDTYRHLVADGGLFVTAVGTSDREKIAAFTVKPTPCLPHHYQCVACGYQTMDGTVFADNRHACAAPNPANKRPHPDFSCFLIRRECWERVGPFDEEFGGAYCEDSDYHVRMHRAGITAMALELPFYHVASGTIKNSEPAEVERIQQAAERNRALFKRKYGCEVGSPEYYALFTGPAGAEGASPT